MELSGAGTGKVPQQLPEADTAEPRPEVGTGHPSPPDRAAGIQPHSFMPQNGQWASSVLELALLGTESRLGSCPHGAQSPEGVDSRKGQSQKLSVN